MKEAVRPGATVRVPHGKSGRVAEGVCVRVSEQAWENTRQPVLEVVDAPFVLDEALVQLGLWIAEYYACPPGKAISTLMPTPLRKKRTRRILFVKLAGVMEEMEGMTKGQRALLEVLRDGGEQRREDVLMRADVGAGVLAGLKKRGLVVVEERREERTERADEVMTSLRDVDAAEDRYVLNDGQAEAVHEITASATEAPSGASRFTVFLLFGVPGSGKTEVYVRSIRSVVAAGRQAIVIVPEIALATQVVERLARRFDRVCVMHSRLTDRQRAAYLRAIAAGKVEVVIGTRSAVVAPCPRLGLIVVDEEQDASLKSLGSPRFHARDVAIMRARMLGIPVVLGSATPAIETWHNARTLAHFRTLRLEERVGSARFPRVRCVRKKPEFENPENVIGPELASAIREVLESGEQAILLHNRRGYAVRLSCEACGMGVTCARCGRHMVFHRSDGLMRCHECGERAPTPVTCRDRTCGGRMRRVGYAIQKLEEELRAGFPRARLLRLDSDTMRRRGDYASVLGAFERREADVLIGTQMVAKGLDFPSVRLVGVIDADAVLWMPDFRARERTFQLVAQVVGRAGRREGESLAIVQTMSAADGSIAMASRLEYEAFAEDELEARKRAGLPPWRRMLRIVVSDERAGVAMKEAERLASVLKEEAARVRTDIAVHPPERCAVFRARGMMRAEIMMLGPRDLSMQRLLKDLQSRARLHTRARRMMIDVDPVELL